MCCRNDYRFSIYFLSECTQLWFVQLFSEALLLLLLLLYRRLYNARGLKTERIKTAEMTIIIMINV